ncbi:MAG TPA: 3-methyl-2-oxobutanoate hydroxymethyltransferase, partial [Thermoanaerobaculia bacterium]|nr:3-methyl-2-oxobutanoate hydroxymethyltransferase [Thermoanaerobaculia bacterium]
HDVMGMNPDFKPKFARRYANLAASIADAARAFTRDVKDGGFPSAEESFSAARSPALRRVY